MSLLYTHSLPTRKPYGGTAPSSSRPPGPPPCAAPPRRRARARPPAPLEPFGRQRARGRWWLAGVNGSKSCAEAEGGGSCWHDPSGFGCLFEPLSRCSPYDSRDALPFTPGGEDDSESVGEESGAPAPRFWLPHAGRGARARGLLAFRAQLAALLFRPRAALRAATPGARAAPAPPWCGVHLRRGDKTSEAPLPPAEAYVTAVAALAAGARARGTRAAELTVLVVSDDARAARALAARLSREARPAPGALKPNLAPFSYLALV